MKVDDRPDYCDINLGRKREGVLRFKEKDEDGFEYESKLMCHDALAAEFFAHMKLPYDTIGFHKKYAITKDKTIVWADDKRIPDEQCSLQFKGGFFLQPDWREQMKSAMGFIKAKIAERKILMIHATRYDRRLLFQVDDEQKFYKALHRVDWGLLVGHARLEKGHWSGFEANHTRLEVDYYNKQKQIIAKKKDDPFYYPRFLKMIGKTEVPPNLMNVDFRIRQKDQTKEITRLLLEDEIDYDAINKEVASLVADRVTFTPALKKIMGFDGKPHQK